MPYWSGEKLESRLREIVSSPDKKRIDCAAYTLRVGAEYYVTPSAGDSNPQVRTLQRLAAGETFAIPPGQLAMILTEEIVHIPADAIGFISIRARIKWKGLINVSGFHVDPGFHGRLTFSVYNVGTTPLHLRRGDPTFLLWLADLDRASTSPYTKHGSSRVDHIDVGTINAVSGEVHSLATLSATIRDTENRLNLRMAGLEKANGVVSFVASSLVALALALGVGVGGRLIYDAIKASNDAVDVGGARSEDGTG